MQTSSQFPGGIPGPHCAPTSAVALQSGLARQPRPQTPPGSTTGFLTSWAIPEPKLFLFGGPFCLAFASHCGLPIFPPGQRCTYTLASTGRPCSAPLGSGSQHVHCCASAPCMARHNQIRDTWADLLKKAGWTVRVEQLVPTATGHKRADLVATGPQGEDIALDVMVTAPPDVLEPPPMRICKPRPRPSPRDTMSSTTVNFLLAPSSSH